MLFDTLRAKNFYLCRQGKESFYRHVGLSRLWARSLLGAKEATFAAVVLIGIFIPEFYGEQLWALGAIIAALIICLLPYRLSLRLLVAYHVFATARILGFGGADFFKPDILAQLDLAASRVLFFEGVLVAAALAFRGIRAPVFGALALVAAALGLAGSGLTPIGTLNTTFVAILLPFVPPIFLPLALTAIILEKGALSYGLVALHLLVFGVFYKSRLYLGAFLVSVVLGGYYLGQSIYCSGRAVFYPWALQEWLGADRFFGTGLGSFQVLGPFIQKANHFDPGQYWLSLHNEWIQALLETGLVGVILLLWVFFDFLVRNRSQPILFSTMLALGGAGFFYYPFKIPIFALVFAVLIAEGMRDATHVSPKN